MRSCHLMGALGVPNQLSYVLRHFSYFLKSFSYIYCGYDVRLWCSVFGWLLHFALIWVSLAMKGNRGSGTLLTKIHFFFFFLGGDLFN